MAQNDLTRLSDAVQDQILELYETNNNDIESQIKHWSLIRRQNAIYYYARRAGYTRLGLQPIPALVASEYNGKEAIALTLLLRSLQRSQFANEDWTLSDTSVELVRATDPKNAFKKEPYIVEVWFDGEQQNAFPYTNWNRIYVQREDETWYVAEGHVDYNGLYYIDDRGDKAYFTLFATDAPRYGTKNYWTVHYRGLTISPPASSSRAPPGSSDVVLIDSDSDTDPDVPETRDTVSLPSGSAGHPTRQPQEESERPRQAAEAEKSPGIRRRQQGEPGPQARSPVKKAKADSSGESRETRGPRGEGTGGRGGGRRGGGGARGTAESAPSAAEVGRRHFTVARRGLTKLERLQEEARDPLIIIVQGQPNCLKCWRYRMRKHSGLYRTVSTVFRWLDNSGKGLPLSRLLVSFKSASQRQTFLSTVTIPRQCSYALGNLDAL